MDSECSQPEDLSVGGSKGKRSEPEEVLVKKKAKFEVEVEGEDKNGQEDSSLVRKEFKTFQGFKVDSVLSNSAEFKKVVIEASLNGTKDKAVVILDKKPFTEDLLKDLFSERSLLTHTFQNDIYGSYDCVLEPKLSGMRDDDDSVWL